MIRKIEQGNYTELSRYLARDSARSYFIRLGLLDDKTFQTVYADFAETGVPVSVLCQRRSGTLQLWSDGSADMTPVVAVMEQLQWNRLISPQGCCQSLISEGVLKLPELGAWIASLKVLHEPRNYEALEPLREEDIHLINELYDQVFDHHMSISQMRVKLSSGRGRGVLIRRKGRIVSVAQTEFEETESALIVGVATDPNYQRLGLAEACTVQLCQSLLKEGKVPWLQYDNPVAGRMYEKIGFEKEDRIVHFLR